MNFLTPNTDNFDNFYEKTKFLLSWRVSLVVTIVFTILVFTLDFNDNISYIPGISALAVSLGGFIYLNITKNVIPLFWIYSIIGTFLVHLATNYTTNLIHYVNFIWMAVIVITAFIGLGKRMGFVFAIIQVIALSYFIFFGLNEHISIVQTRTTPELIGIMVELFLAFIVLTYLLDLFIKLNKYSENQLLNVNDKLLSKNKENTVLMKEIHHRVKNNLQIITSLLRLQKSDIPIESQEKFDQAIGRIMTMSIIHKKLYQTEELSNIDTSKYLSELIDEILSTYPSSDTVIKEVLVHIENIGLKTLVPLGLLLNELISNSFKHAFANDTLDLIKIDISPVSTNEFKFSYCDNGQWKEKDGSETKFGSELINILTEQLDGNFRREKSEYTFNLKNLDI